jgi:hypothetical protein
MALIITSIFMDGGMAPQPTTTMATQWFYAIWTDLVFSIASRRWDQIGKQKSSK